MTRDSTLDDIVTYFGGNDRIMGHNKWLFSCGLAQLLWENYGPHVDVYINTKMHDQSKPTLPMMIAFNSDWIELNDLKDDVNGMLEYIGQGKSYEDHGLAMPRVYITQDAVMEQFNKDPDNFDYYRLNMNHNNRMTKFEKYKHQFLCWKQTFPWRSYLIISAIITFFYLLFKV